MSEQETIIIPAGLVEEMWLSGKRTLCTKTCLNCIHIIGCDDGLHGCARAENSTTRITNYELAALKCNDYDKSVSPNSL